MLIILCNNYNRNIYLTLHSLSFQMGYSKEDTRERTVNRANTRGKVHEIRVIIPDKIVGSFW